MEVHVLNALTVHHTTRRKNLQAVIKDIYMNLGTQNLIVTVDQQVTGKLKPPINLAKMPINSRFYLTICRFTASLCYPQQVTGKLDYAQNGTYFI